MRRLNWLPVFTGLWLMVSLVGAYWLLEYNYTPGPDGGVAELWPQEASHLRTVGTAQLVLVVHPKCPCTFSSINELERILASSGRTPQITVLAYQPKSGNWERTSLIRKIGQLPNTEVVEDSEGKLARLFGGLTSGSLRLYNADGVLTFSGGVTAMRGMEGRSLSGEALISALAEKPIEQRSFAVFGCPIIGGGAHD